MAENILQAPPVSARRRFAPSRATILIVGLIAIFVLSYILAWWSAYRLSLSYLEDADASYEEGRYLDALVGYEQYDQAKRSYIERGGYLQVERIWASEYALPVPPRVERARERIQEIIYKRLTIEDAEQFVQENIGRNNPYMGLIYLRLGELYEADGNLRDAQDIYESIPDLFPNDETLIERAQKNLQNLLAKQSGS